MSINVQKWTELKDDDLWIFEKVQKTDLEYAETEIKNLRTVLHNMNLKNDEFENNLSDQKTHTVELIDALSDLVKTIESAGLLNLSTGVQLGSTVWYVKASDSINYAKQILEKRISVENS